MDVKKGCDMLDESWVEMKRFKEPYYWVAAITIPAQIPGKRGLELDIEQNPLTLSRLQHNVIDQLSQGVYLLEY